MDSITGFLLVVFTATMSGEGASTVTVPTIYNSQSSCEVAAKKTTFEGQQFGLRLDSRGVCIPFGALAPVSFSTSSPNGNKGSP